MLPTRDSLQLQEHTQAQSEGMEKDNPCKWKPKEYRGSSTYIRENRL